MIKNPFYLPQPYDVKPPERVYAKDTFYLTDGEDDDDEARCQCHSFFGQQFQKAIPFL